MNNYTISQILEFWWNSEEAKSVGKQYNKNLKIALKRYVLPAVDSNFEQFKNSSFEEYLEQANASLLENAVEVFDEEFEECVKQNKVSRATGKNYRSALTKLITWLQSQTGCQNEKEILNTNDISPNLPKLNRKPKKSKGKKEIIKLFENELEENLKNQLKEYQKFRLLGGKNQHSNSEKLPSGRRKPKPRIDPVVSSTINEETEKILYFLGWYNKTYPNKQLDLTLITDCDLLDEFIEWQVETRQVSYLTGFNTASVAIAVAKWLNYYKTQRRNWSDITLISELKNLRLEYKEEHDQYKEQIKREKWNDKQITFQQLSEVIEYLGSCCASRRKYKNGNSYQIGHRPKSAIFRDFQRYLLVKTFTYCPVRQGELKKWELNQTIFRKFDELGNPYYLVCLKDHKRSSTGRERRYRLPSILTSALDTWIYQVQPKIAESIQTLEGWMNFWGYSLKEIERLYERIEKAQKGELDHKIKTSRETYIQNLNKQLRSREARKAGWATAKANLEANNYVFFMFGKHNPNVFGKSFYHSTMWETVRSAIAQATASLFGESQWVNPHAFRYIAEKHVRALNDPDLAEKFGIFIGHSKESGDQYAAQITSELEETENIVDDWWHDKA